MNATILENYLSQFSKTKDNSKKDNIIEEIKSRIANETPAERTEGIEVIGEKVNEIAMIIDKKTLTNNALIA